LKELLFSFSAGSADRLFKYSQTRQHNTLLSQHPFCLGYQFVQPHPGTHLLIIESSLGYGVLSLFLKWHTVGE
jgi:hypothetical protein